jgi:hypothetical protein
MVGGKRCWRRYGRAWNSLSLQPTQIWTILFGSENPLTTTPISLPSRLNSRPIDLRRFSVFPFAETHSQLDHSTIMLDASHGRTYPKRLSMRTIGLFPRQMNRAVGLALSRTMLRPCSARMWRRRSMASLLELRRRRTTANSLELDGTQVHCAVRMALRRDDYGLSSGRSSSKPCSGALRS